VGSFSVAILYGKYTACVAGYIGMNVGVKSRDRVRGEIERRMELRKNM
jgi:Na+/H+-translocating membrane pyrophosphatase